MTADKQLSSLLLKIGHFNTAEDKTAHLESRNAVLDDLSHLQGVNCVFEITDLSTYIGVMTDK